MDIESPARDLGPENNGTLKQLRTALINGSKGSITGVPLKLHYDDMRRISKQNYDYYFAPLERTAFSIGIALPNTFGKFFLKVDDEIKKNKHMGVNITTFFQGKNWKIHPKWCRLVALGRNNCTDVVCVLGCIADIITWKDTNSVLQKKNSLISFGKSTTIISILNGDCNMKSTKMRPMMRKRRKVIARLQLEQK